MPVHHLKMECSKCQLTSTCPRVGSSPLLFAGKQQYCHIVGGYGREPIRSEILSPESLLARDKDGPCLTIAYIPTLDEDPKYMTMELTKIFAPPVLHDRESVSWNTEMLYPKSH